MKLKLIIIKNLFAVILLGGLALTMLVLGTGMLIENQSRNLSKMEMSIGKVKKTEVVKEISKVGTFPFQRAIEQNHLIIELNTKDIFGTFNPEQNYSSIQKLNGTIF